LTEAPPRAALDRSAATRSRGTLPQVIKPNASEPGREPAKVEKASKGEPEIIRGGTGERVYENKQSGNQRVEPRPTVSRPSVEKSERPVKGEDKSSGKPRSDQGQQGSHQNFGTRGSSRYSPAAPDSIQPRQRTTREPTPQKQPSHEERTSEKQSQSHPEQGREENPKKGQ
jgi:hypothetical protein